MRKALLVLLILASAYPCLAKYSGGTGEPNDPYQIANAADLMTLAADANDYNKCFIMTADVNLDPNLPGGRIFRTAVISPDANDKNGDYDGNSFKGVFNGNGYKITNLVIDTNGISKWYIGLFGVIEDANISDLGLENASVNGSSSWVVGSLVGSNQGSTISHCYSINAIVTGKVDLGGLLGNTTGLVSNCYSTGVVTGLYRSGDTGGFAGVAGGVISDCFSATTVNGGNESDCFGGLIGQNYGNIINCYASGNVAVGSASYHTGGLVGWNYGSINNSCSKGNVTGGSGSGYFGGLVGAGSNNPSKSSINNCYSIGNVIGGANSGAFGGLAGLAAGTINNSYSIGVVTCGGQAGGLTPSPWAIVTKSYFLNTSGPDTGYGTPLTDAQMKQQASFVGWDFVWETVNGPNDVWAICEGVSYPKLAWQFIAGDTDNDKDVDFTDFAPLANKWMQADSNLYCGGSDLTGDGWVDLKDLAVFANNWLQ